MVYPNKNNKKSITYLTVIFIALFTLITICLIHKPQATNNLRFQIPTPIEHNCIANAYFESYFIAQPEHLLAAHSALFDILSDGSLFAVWFAGSHEGKPDVQIFQSRFESGAWQEAQAIVSRAEASANTKTFIKKIGNPVVYRALDGKLHLFVVVVSLGGWSGSSIVHLISSNNGNTWGDSKKLKLTPVFNISTLVRTGVITLNNGDFYLPIYHESMRSYPELLYFDSQGEFICQARFNDQNHLIQPAIVPISPTTAYVYFRNHTKQIGTLMMQVSHDAGNTWGNIKKTNITNQDSSIAVVGLGDGKLLMVRNIDGRGKLILSISTTNDGLKWKDIVYLENGSNGEEFSYPSIQRHGDTIDILYTWKRKCIKHVRFNLVWLNQQMGKSI